MRERGGNVHTVEDAANSVSKIAQEFDLSLSTVWVALAWGFYVVVNALAIYFRRPTDDAEIEREMERLTTR